VRGLFYGSAGQLGAQVIGTLTCFVFIFAASWAFFRAMDAVMGMRVSPEVELEGLDVPEMGGHGYPEIQGPGTAVHGVAGAAAAGKGFPTPAMAGERGR
jgi:Amt family ammonium transporter